MLYLLPFVLAVTLSAGSPLSNSTASSSEPATGDEVVAQEEGQERKDTPPDRSGSQCSGRAGRIYCPTP
jgi:hypothetical protein